MIAWSGMVRATAMVLVKASTATATIASVRPTLISHGFIDGSFSTPLSGKHGFGLKGKGGGKGKGKGGGGGCGGGGYD